MNKVERAIIMAAGIGSRMRPLTLTTPKPLVKVNGIAMIETVIDALHSNGINEIYIVVGYLKEQFSYLASKYEGVTIVENPYYDKCNNMSSLYVVRDHLENTFIVDGDQVIYNKDIFNPMFDRSGYSCIYTTEDTDEWLLQTKDNIVTSCSRTGGRNGYQLFSVSRWSKEDGLKLKEQVAYEFDRGNTNIYWDDIALFCHPEDYKLQVYEIKKGDLIEIDNYQELLDIDPSYKQKEVN